MKRENLTEKNRLVTDTWSIFRKIKLISLPMTLDSRWQSAPSLLVKSPMASLSKKDISYIKIADNTVYCFNNFARITHFRKAHCTLEVLQLLYSYEAQTWKTITEYRVPLRRLTCNMTNEKWMISYSLCLQNKTCKFKTSCLQDDADCGLCKRKFLISITLNTIHHMCILRKWRCLITPFITSMVSRNKYSCWMSSLKLNLGYSF